MTRFVSLAGTIVRTATQPSLRIGEIVGAWSDTRVFRDGHWHFEDADPALRSLHHVAGGHFYAIGEALDA